MCLTPPSAPVITPTPAAAPPPPPARDPNPAVLAPDANARADASTKKTGTSIFRNDLSIPTAGSVGTGLNVPK